MLLSLEKLLEIFPDGKLDARRTNIITFCPECGEREFSISLSENHLCGCYRKKMCGWRGNLFSLMKKIGRTDILVNRDINYSKVEVVKLFIDEVQLELETEEVSSPIGWKRVYEDDYLSSRGYDQFNRYKVGITNVDPRLNNFVVFLIEEENKIKGWIGRNRKSKKDIEKLNQYYKIKGEEKKVSRYLNSLSDFSKLVFGIEEITENTKILIVVEGIFDKFNIDKLLNLHEQEAIKCICTFKCAFSKEQIFKIQQKAINLETTILLYDPDVIDDIKKAAFSIRGYLGDILVGMPNNDHDPGDFNEDDIDYVLENLKSPSAFGSDKLGMVKLKI